MILYFRHFLQILLKWRFAHYKLISENPNTPNINLLIISTLIQLLRTNISQTPNNSLPHTVTVDRTPKISNLNITLHIIKALLRTWASYQAWDLCGLYFRNAWRWGHLVLVWWCRRFRIMWFFSYWRRGFHRLGTPWWGRFFFSHRRLRIIGPNFCGLGRIVSLLI